MKRSKQLQGSSPGLSKQERAILDAFSAAERPAVTAADVQKVLPVSRSYANQILARLSRKGWLLRVHRGTYAIVPLGSPTPAAAIKDPHALAMTLFAPCYIAGWSAAEHWDLTEQIFNAIAVVTARPQRRRTRKVAGISFVCRVVDASAIFGTQRVWSGATQVDIADPHRLVIDILYSPELGGGARHTLDIVRNYWRSKHAAPDMLMAYAKRLGKGVVFKRLGFTAEKFGHVPSEWIEQCRRGMTQGISDLDPNGPKRGKTISKWRLRINVPIEQA